MKLVSAKYKRLNTAPSERINFINEIEIKSYSTQEALNLSDFNSDIICFNPPGKPTSASTIRINCDMPGRKYTFILHSSAKFSATLEFYSSSGMLSIYRNSDTSLTPKPGNATLVVLYQPASNKICILAHELTI